MLKRLTPVSSIEKHTSGFMYTDMSKRALRIACKAHEGQEDKAGLPYIFHPFHLAEQMDTEDEICAALLHDVVEDSIYTFDDLIEAGISKEVLDVLHLLTHNDHTPYIEYVLNLRNNPIARKVKMADLTHNSDIHRLSIILPRDLERIRKYHIAYALLDNDEYKEGLYYKKIPLDDYSFYYMTLVYDEDGLIKKYLLEVDSDIPAYYEVLGDLSKLEDHFCSGRSLFEDLAEYFLNFTMHDLLCLLKELSIEYKKL